MLLQHHAMEKVPTCVWLRKAAIELADQEEAHVLLARATECCPKVHDCISIAEDS